jgi:outer membrane biosynthesis protein TonB
MRREKSISIWLATATLLAAAFASGCSSKLSDAQLVTNIQSQMFADAQLKSASLQVAAVNGEVTLKGNVPNDAARYEAYKIATQTSGVTKVVDQMLVEDQSTPESSADAPPAAPALPPAPVATPAKPAKPAALPKPHTSHHPTVNPDTEIAQVAPQPDPSQIPAPPPPDSQPDQSSTPAAPTAAATPAPPPPPPPAPKQFVVDAGTTITIRMIDSIDSSVNQAGEVFHASLDAPIVVGNDVVVPKGVDVYVRLATAKSAGKVTGQSELGLELVKLEYQGQTFPLVSTTYSESGKSRGKDTAKKVGGGAVLGAIIGAVAGGGKGAAIGGAVGAGAGGVYQGATHGQQVKIPSETKLDFQLDQPATITQQQSTN